MTLLACLLAIVVQAPAATDPIALSEWQVLADPRIWGESASRGRDWPASEPPTVAPLEITEWLYVLHSATVSAANVLARWIVQPDAPPPKSAAEDELVEAGSLRWTAMPPGEPRPACCAYATIASPVDEVRLARAPGAKWIVWNGELFVGDEQSRGFSGVPVRVRRGVNTCFAALDGGVPLCSLESPRANAWIEAFDVRWPSTTAFGEPIEYPVFNASERTIEVSVSYGYASHWTAECAPLVTEVGSRGRIVPLGLQLCEHYYFSPAESCRIESSGGAQSEWSPVEARGDDGAISDRRMLRRGPGSFGAACNNVVDVRRERRAAARGLVACLPQDSVHLYAGGAGEIASLALARFVQQTTWYRFGDVPRLSSASDYLADEQRGGELSRRSSSAPIVLYGNADTNPAWQRFVPDRAPCDARAGRVVVRGVVFEGDDLAGWFTITNKERSRDVRAPESSTSEHDELAGWSLYLVPRDEHDVCVVFDTGDRGARLAALLAVSWDGPPTPSAVFRADPSSPREWKRIDVDERR